MAKCLELAPIQKKRKVCCKKRKEKRKEKRKRIEQKKGINKDKRIKRTKRKEQNSPLDCKIDTIPSESLSYSTVSVCKFASSEEGDFNAT